MFVLSGGAWGTVVGLLAAILPCVTVAVFTPEVPSGTFAGALLVTVRDRGEGLDEQQLDKLFEPFHTTRVKGTGLGLAVARRLVELHGGHIEAQPQASGGALFRVTIPA